ncbi:MAG: TonB family protein [Acidobacteriota bacterium]|jgi:protein TonB|nr:TonB family protein [Acidobacteriota bacterium]
MLEYAASLNQKRGIPRRAVVCLMASLVAHLAVILVLFLFPELLAGGYYDQFHGFRWGAADDLAPDDPWRTVAVLEPPERMNMPSPEVLRRLMGQGDKEEGMGTPPIEVRFGPLEALEVDNPPLPQVPPKVENPEVEVPPSRAQNANPEAKSDTGDVDASPKPVQADRGTGRDLVAAKPDATPKVEVASDAAPRKIPDSIRPPSPPAASQSKPGAAKESGGTPGIGLFDTKGFPLGEYEEAIVARVKSRWFIPSNLKQSQGKTTVVFYIDKNGRCANLRVASSSGSNSLDLAALSAVTESDPFPPLPKGFPGERIGVRLVLNLMP